MLCESNCVCHLLGTLIQCKSTRHTVELCLRDEKTLSTLISSNSTWIWILPVSRRFADYVNLFGKILKFRNVNVTNEYTCIQSSQLDMLRSFELIKNKFFLILKSNIFWNFFQININEKLHVPSCCTTQYFVPYMHIDEHATWFFLNL